MKKEQVLILYESSLFAEGLVSILKQERVIKIEKLVSRRENGWRPIESLRPDVVIIEGDNPMADANGALCELLRHNTKGRVISVNLKHKDAVIYVGIRFPATESNLIKALKNGVHCSFERLIEKEGQYESIQKGKAL